MKKLEQALEALNNKGIDAKIENDCIYVTIEGYDLELSDYEVNYQAEEYLAEQDIEKHFIP